MAEIAVAPESSATQEAERWLGAFETALAELLGTFAENASREPGRLLSNSLNSMVARLRRGGR